MCPNQPADPTAVPISDEAMCSQISREVAAEARRAARYALNAYPGPIGELISRELHRFVEAGEQLSALALPPRLIAALRQSEARNPQPPLPNWNHLPARYIPGTPLHWRYRTDGGDA